VGSIGGNAPFDKRSPIAGSGNFAIEVLFYQAAFVVAYGKATFN